MESFRSRTFEDVATPHPELMHTDTTTPGRHGEVVKNAIRELIISQPYVLNQKEVAEQINRSTGLAGRYLQDDDMVEVRELLQGRSANNKQKDCEDKCRDNSRNVFFREQRKASVREFVISQEPHTLNVSAIAAHVGLTRQTVSNYLREMPEIAALLAKKLRHNNPKEVVKNAIRELLISQPHVLNQKEVAERVNRSTGLVSDYLRDDDMAEVRGLLQGQLINNNKQREQRKASVREFVISQEPHTLSISAIAAHVGLSRTTVRSYLGEMPEIAALLAKKSLARFQQKYDKRADLEVDAKTVISAGRSPNNRCKAVATEILVEQLFASFPDAQQLTIERIASIINRPIVSVEICLEEKGWANPSSQDQVVVPESTDSLATVIDPEECATGCPLDKATQAVEDYMDNLEKPTSYRQVAAATGLPLRVVRHAVGELDYHYMISGRY